MSSSRTVTYNTVAALALEKLDSEIANAISTANKILYFLKKQGNWEGISYGGERLRKTVLTQLRTIYPIGSYGYVNTNPVESHTSVWYTYVQTAIPVTFSDLEEFQTGGTESIKSIVKARFDQAVASGDELMSKSILRGQADLDNTSFTTPRTSPTDGSYFIDPLPMMVSFSPTSSLTYGGIDQSTNSWWQNQYADINTTTTLTAFLSELRKLHVKCQRGGGKQPTPNMHLVDERTYSIYERALALTQRFTGWGKADIPFDNILFKNAPVIFDELMPDIKTGDLSSAVTYGTWYMLNTEYMGFVYDKKSFKLGEQVRPDNQLVTTALMPIRGAFWQNNRRKQAVLGGITLATLEAATS